jgi:uncharacterized membrane protein YczE
MKQNYFRKTIALTIGAIMLYVGAAIQVRLNIGVGAFDAFAVTLTYITKLGLGTIISIFNIISVIIQIAIEKKKFKPIEFLQLIFIVFGGFTLDFFLDFVFKDFYIENYFLIVVVFILSLILRVVGVIFILEAKLFRLPIEGACQVISDQTRFSLGFVRTVLDVICIVLAISLTLLLTLNWTIREGTIFTILLQGPMLDLFKKPTVKLFKKLKIN